MSEPVQPSLFEIGRPGVIQDNEILDHCRNRWLVTESYDPKNVEACSYDIRVGTRAILGGTSQEVDLRKDPLILGPGCYAGVVSMEKIRLPANVLGRIGAKRVYSYEGIILLTGVMVDPSYEGYLLFTLFNASPRKYTIRSGYKLCNIVFERLEQKAARVPTTDARLAAGEFPHAFLQAMDRMEIEPLSQIGERVTTLTGALEQTRSELKKIQARYDDVVKPIQDLTANVQRISTEIERVTADVQTVSTDLRSIGANVSKLDSFVQQNNQQIATLTQTMTALSTRSVTVEDRTTSNIHALSQTLSTVSANAATLEERARRTEGKQDSIENEVKGLLVKMARYSVIFAILTAVGVALVSGLVQWVFKHWQ